MKKLIKSTAILFMVFALIGFSACSGNNNNSNIENSDTGTSEEKNQTNQETGANDTSQSNPEPASELQHICEMLGRFSTQEGYYFYKSYHPSNNMEDGYDNLMYIDYATGKQVYLCSKANCAHNDSGCTSYIQVEGAQGLFTYQEKLYRLSNAYSADDQIVPGLFESELDGSNQKNIYQLESGRSWLRDFVLGNGIIYADVMVMEEIESNGVVSSGWDDSKSHILAIDLNTGEATDVYDLTDQSIVGAYGDKIIISKVSGDEIQFSLFDTSKKSAVSVGSINSAVYTCDNGQVYYPVNNVLYAMDLETGESKKIADSLPESPDEIEIHDNYAVCARSDVNGATSHFAVALSDGNIRKINLFKSGLEFKSPVEVEGEFDDYFLVLNGYKMEKEYVDWVGVWQDFISEERYALIKKEDFFSGKAEYQPINY